MPHENTDLSTFKKMTYELTSSINEQSGRSKFLVGVSVGVLVCSATFVLWRYSIKSRESDGAGDPSSKSEGDSIDHSSSLHESANIASEKYKDQKVGLSGVVERSNDISSHADQSSHTSADGHNELEQADISYVSENSHSAESASSRSVGLGKDQTLYANHILSEKLHHEEVIDLSHQGSRPFERKSDLAQELEAENRDDISVVSNYSSISIRASAGTYVIKKQIKDVAHYVGFSQESIEFSMLHFYQKSASVQHNLFVVEFVGCPTHTVSELGKFTKKILPHVICSATNKMFDASFIVAIKSDQTTSGKLPLQEKFIQKLKSFYKKFKASDSQDDESFGGVKTSIEDAQSTNALGLSVKEKYSVIFSSIKYKGYLCFQPDQIEETPAHNNALSTIEQFERLFESSDEGIGRELTVVYNTDLEVIDCAAHFDFSSYESYMG